MKRTIFFILVIFCRWQVLYADASAAISDGFRLGCDFYKKAEYEKALLQFKLLEEKYPTASVLYNIGNTYFRLGKIGYALVYYERAKKISPIDNDVNFNIKFLAEMIKDHDYKQTFFSAADASWFKLFFSLSFFFFVIIISVKLLNPGRVLFWPVIGSFVFFALFSSTYLIKYRQQKQAEAVVVSNIAEIRSGPGNSFKVNFTLPEGKKIIILNRSGNWVEVGVKSLGIKGWLEEKNIEII